MSSVLEVKRIVHFQADIMSWNHGAIENKGNPIEKEPGDDLERILKGGIYYAL